MPVVDGVSHEALEMFGQPGRRGAGHGKDVIDLLAQPAQAIGVDQPGAGTVAQVAAAAMPDGTQVEERRARRHGRLDHVIVGTGFACRSPAMASGHHAGRAVSSRERIQGPHHGDLELDAGDGDRIDGVVAVEHLVGLAGVDLDRRAASDQVGLAMGKEEGVENAHHPPVTDDLGGCRRDVENGVDAQGGVAVELALGGTAHRIEGSPEVGENLVDDRTGHEVLHDGRSVARDRRDDAVDGGIAGKPLDRHGAPGAEGTPVSRG